MKPLTQLNDEEFDELARRALALAEAPPALVRSATELWDRAGRASLRATAAALAERVAAVLAFDSWAGAAIPAGMRALPSDSRHLLFSAKGRDIDLRIVPAQGRFALTGQVLGPDAEGKVELATAADDSSGRLPLQVATLDELGEFRLDSVERGVYRLTLSFGTDEIELPRIEVGERGQ